MSIEFKQQIIESTINRTDEGFLHDTKLVCGRRVEKGKFIKIETTTFMDYDHLELFIYLVEHMSIQNILNYVFKRLEKYKCCVFFKQHSEKVLINGVIDNREYGYIKIVGRDNYDNTYFKEIPVFLDDLPDDIYRRLEPAIEDILKELRQEKLYIGSKELKSKLVVFSPQATGYFIHEVVGHMLEEDVYEFSRNFIHNCLNVDLSVVDDAKGYEKLIGTGKIDDCGAIIKRLRLIEAGKVKNIIDQNNNMAGVARRSDYRSKALSRMRCTFVEPCSKNTQESYLQQNRNVILVDNIYSGNASFVDGRFSLGGTAKIIERGEKKESINNLIINSSIKEYLKKIVDIGGDIAIFGTECNKIGEIVRVGVGGPSILFEGVNLCGDFYGYEE